VKTEPSVSYLSVEGPVIKFNIFGTFRRSREILHCVVHRFVHRTNYHPNPPTRMPKATTSGAESRQLRHNPLEDDLLATGPLRSKPSKRKSGKEDDEEDFVDSRASRNILRIGQELADEEEEAQRIARPNAAFEFDSRYEDEDKEASYEDEEAWGDEDEIVEEVELAPEDLETFSKFFPVQEDPLLRQGWGGTAEEPEQEQGTNLADLILAKIAAHEAAQESQNIAGQSRGAEVINEDYELPPKVVEVYTK
jgi:essential nuclear protein 1